VSLQNKLQSRLNKVEERLAPAVERTERLVRDWEWTWTKAVIASLLISILVLITLGIVPSWWLYFAQQKLRWQTLLWVELRDLIATGWIGTWFLIFLVAASVLQNMRRKLRGARSEARPTGGYR